MFYIFSIFLIAFLGTAFGNEEPEKDGHVLVLTKDTFDKAVGDAQFVLVEFYAPWCGHCKALEPHYQEAAKILNEKKSPIKLAKVDATVNKEVADKYSVKGYPTIKFFKNGNIFDAIDYTGERSPEKIVAWLEKKTQPAVIEIKTSEEAQQIKKDHKSHICGCFTDKESAKAKTFSAVADSTDDHVFTMVTDEQLCKEFEAEADNVVFYSQDKAPTKCDLEEFSEAEFKKWILVHSLDEIVDFSHKTAPKIFGGEINSHLLLFFSQNEGHFDKYLAELKSVANNHRGKVMFVSVNTDEPDHERILEFFGMKKEEVPSYRLISMEGDMVKYKPDKSDISADDIQKFVSDYLEGKLKPHLLSQDPPADWDKKPVMVLVTSTFDAVVFDKTKDVLVMYFAPWCGHCKQLEPIYEKLGEHFKGDEAVVIAKIDATANELEHTKITSFPTIKLYTKDNQVHDYNGERSLDALIKFVESGGESAGPETAVDEEEEKEEEPATRDEL